MPAMSVTDWFYFPRSAPNRPQQRPSNREEGDESGGFYPPEFSSDVAVVRRAIALAEGDVVLIDHSDAGAVIGRLATTPRWHGSSMSTPSHLTPASPPARCSRSSGLAEPSRRHNHRRFAERVHGSERRRRAEVPITLVFDELVFDLELLE
jgi:hypothetical protein